MNIDELNLQAESEIRGDDEEDTRLLRMMALTARNFVSGFAWCPPINTVHLAFGIGGIVGVFLVRFQHPINDTDDALWVIVGDVPSAYLVLDDIKDGREALTVYCKLMEEWAFAVLNGNSLESVFPVDAKPTSEVAVALRERIAFIRSEIVDT